MIYAGVFFDKDVIETLAPEKLEKTIQFPHVTFKFRPSKEEAEIFQQLKGEKVDVYIFNFKKNEENAGFYVAKIETENEMIQNLFLEIPCPHITTSVSENGKPVNTYKLFEDELLEEKEIFKVVSGTFGYFENGKPNI